MNPETLEKIRENFEKEGLRRGYEGELLAQYVNAAMEYWNRVGSKPKNHKNVSQFTSGR